MIQVYQLRRTSPDPLTTSTIKEQISTCMNALEQVSKTWLVATMVHNLFENILQWVIPDAPRREALETSTSGISISDFGAQTPAESALLNSTLKVEALPVRTKPLTPGLKDYLDAALQPVKSYMSDPIADEVEAQQLRQQNALELKKDLASKGLQFLPEDEELEWDYEDAPRTPVSTGLNPALW